MDFNETPGEKKTRGKLHKDATYCVFFLRILKVAPNKQQLDGRFHPTQRRPTKHAGNGWESKDELISDVLQWSPTHGYNSFDKLAKTYIH